MFDKYELSFFANQGDLKTVQQIAFVLEAIDSKFSKLASFETAQLRMKLDNYLNVKKNKKVVQFSY